MTETRTMNQNNAQTCRLFINSEADAFVAGQHAHGPWEPQTDGERACDDLHRKLMGHFRNWERLRGGGDFSDTKDCCWLPNACITDDGRVLGLLSTELSSRDNAFMERPDGPERAEVDAGIDRLLAGLAVPAGVTAAKREFEPGYFEIDVTFPPAHADAGVQMCVEIGRRLAADPVLSRAQEWIG